MGALRGQKVAGWVRERNVVEEIIDKMREIKKNT